VIDVCWQKKKLPMPIISNSRLIERHKLIIALLALIGATIVLLSTSRYGAGLTPDSVQYIGTARNLIKGAGFVSYDGNLMVVWPPLYPALLALLGGVLQIDPFLITNILNAIIFGLLVYFGGMLSFKYFSSFPAFALLGTLTILFSRPLLEVSLMAWTEPLFILLILLGLIFADSYLSKKTQTSLILFSSSAALAVLTRYIGVALILWGTLIILFFSKGALKNKIKSLAIFILISVLPLGLWLIRTYAIAGTFLGLWPKGSANTFFPNIIITFNNLLSWYIPRIITDQRIILIILVIGVVFFIGFACKDISKGSRVGLEVFIPIILFSFIYITFLIVSSTTTAYDPIDDRLLSPIYVPLTLGLLALSMKFVDSYRKRFPGMTVNSFLIIGISIWLLYPIASTIKTAVDVIGNGRGYSGKVWMERETIQYLLQNQYLESRCTIYSNDSYAVYIDAHIPASPSPEKTRNNPSVWASELSSLRDSWPEEKNACLVWLNEDHPSDRFTVDELQTIAKMDLIAQLTDGAIYSITRK
jgi:hypothetical protein